MKLTSNKIDICEELYRQINITGIKIFDQCFNQLKPFRDFLEIRRQIYQFQQGFK